MILWNISINGEVLIRFKRVNGPIVFRMSYLVPVFNLLVLFNRIVNVNIKLIIKQKYEIVLRQRLIVLGLNDTSTLVGHFLSSPREKEKRDRRGDEIEGQGRKSNRNQSEETEEIRIFLLYPYPLQG